ncbi:alpha/beta fold hydrolase [Imhoffiella purpurea]|uniref:Putative alpha/beta hydrolase superfamily n=1 Tax=Imhoffiella purpurea TaxID=1249627 RepID=W9VEL3_9GAMM|nr:alpha/beta hydrolase [Imhoffiella purpurea]EXJ14482.1 Putative alpha/beta hydrolase superfamily [Imhoffiella purpurea]
MILPDALTAPRASHQSASGERVAYYHDSAGSGRPLVLIHSINAACSSFEVKPLFDRYRGRRPVYSLDLPGFGHSARPATGYSPEFYGTAIADFVRSVVGRPADVLALSLSAEFAARAARLAPEHIASLVMVSPTGFGRQSMPGTRSARAIHALLRLPLLGEGLFRLVSSRPSIRYFLGRSLPDGVPPEMIDYAHATSHQPGARHAPFAFLSTALFTASAVERLYAPLKDLPVMVIADRDPYVTFEHLPGLVAEKPNWHSVSLAPHLGLPHWERPDAVVESLDAFWGGADR